MEYNKIVAVTGMPGLYELISTKGDGAVVRSLDDKSTRFASSRIHNISHLESIEVFTVGDNVNLVDVFKAIEKNDGSLPEANDGAAVKKYFEKIYPDMDFERVYNSDLKKMIKWYDALKRNNIEIRLSEPGEVAENSEEKPSEKEIPQAKSEKTSPAKKEK